LRIVAINQEHQIRSVKHYCTSKNKGCPGRCTGVHRLQWPSELPVEPQPRAMAATNAAPPHLASRPTVDCLLAPTTTKGQSSPGAAQGPQPRAIAAAKAAPPHHFLDPRGSTISTGGNRWSPGPVQ
jgi:hypothetical protein